MIVGIMIALLYALPNLYPDLPTLLFSGIEVDQTQVSGWLDNQNIQYWWKGSHLHFSDVDQQMQAKSIIEKQIKSDTELTLNLEKQTPVWLDKISAQAMKLGLDLRGGIHFLLEVDTSEVDKHKGDNQRNQVSELLKTHRIRYTQIEHSEEGLSVDLIDEESLVKAQHVISMYLPQYGMQANGHTVELKGQRDNETSSYVVNQTIHSLEKRINELGISEATIQRQGDNYISIDLPGVQDIVHAKKIIGKAATLRFHMVTEGQFGDILKDQDGGIYRLQPNAILSGDSIAFAHAKMQDGRPIVEIQLDGHAHEFYRSTGEHVGERLAVVYSEVKSDKLIEYIISAPVINQPLGDHFYIQGSGSIGEAKDLALLLRSGALAAPVKFIEETIIGPSLGFDNIFKGVLSLGVGSLIIFIFMAYYYRLLGMIANVALLLNIVVIVAALSLLGATLTLPGIAGIVLSVGMAVDANVLINERIREETLAGSSMKQAVKAGYAKAITAIVDANVTTFLVMIVLFSLGAGAVKGFAITTSIGILSSVFTSVYMTQIATEMMMELGWITEVNMSHDWFSAIGWIDFMAISKKAFIFSAVLLSSCLIVIPFKGINLGLDFTGGGQITIETPDNISSEDVRSVLEELSLPQAQVQTYGQSHVFMIKIPKTNISVESLGKELAKKIRGSKLMQTEFIGPQVGSQMLSNSIIAVGVSLIVMMIYVAIRFEYRFAVSAIVSLIHDPILILGIFSLFQIEFNLIALAAVLTILGYSINDTIVVYDRVREDFQGKIDKTEVIINNAINHTLSRTILTSCLTLAVVLTLLVLGGDYLRGFSLSLAIGIVIGTYSSVYIAGSMAVYLGLKRDDLIIKPEGN